MKRIIIISSIFLACSLQASAQITESSYIIGGSSSFSLAADSEGQSNKWSFGIQPEFAKFVSENWLVGGGLGYGVSGLKSNIGSTETRMLSNNFNGFFGATRFYSLVDKVYFTVEYSLGLSYTTSYTESVFDFGSSEGTSNSGRIGVAASPGLVYFFNQKWMIFARLGSLGYNFDQNFDTNSKVHRVGYNFRANSFGIGVRYVLGTGKPT